MNETPAPSLLKYLRFSSGNLLSLLIAACTLWLALPSIITPWLPAKEIQCSAVANLASTFEPMHLYALKGCEFTEPPSQIDNSESEGVFGVLTNAKQDLVLLRVPETFKADPSNTIKAFVSADTDSLVQAFHQANPDKPWPKAVLISIDSLRSSERFANIVLAVLGVLTFLIVFRIVYKRGQEASIRENSEPVHEDLSGLSVISLTEAALNLKRLHKVLFFFSIWTLFCFAVTLSSKYWPLAVLPLIYFAGNQYFRQVLNNKAPWFYLGWGGVAAIISLATASTSTPEKTLEMVVYIILNFVFAGLLYWLYTKCLKTKLRQDSIQLPALLKQYQALRKLDSLSFLKRLFIPGRYSLAGLRKLLMIVLLIVVGLPMPLAGLPWVWWILAPIALLQWQKAKSKLAPDAQEVLARDARAPVLFLRSFMDDTAELDAHSLMGSNRFEEHVFRAIADLGPPVAIGDPKESMRKLGAYRTYCTDDNWQTVAERWMIESRFVVMFAGMTEMLGWEIKQMFKHGLHNKLIILLPPEHTERRKSRWEQFKKNFQGTPHEIDVSRLAPESLLGLSFSKDGKMVIYRGTHLNLQEYALAIKLAVVNNSDL